MVLRPETQSVRYKINNAKRYSLSLFIDLKLEIL